MKVFCDIHAQMTALIMVLDHPWFTIPADDGTFTLPPVPAGDVTVVAWHERIGERRERVRVTPGDTDADRVHAPGPGADAMTAPGPSGSRRGWSRVRCWRRFSPSR